MNVYAKALQLSRLLEFKERIQQLVDPDMKLVTMVDLKIAELGSRKEEVDAETGEIR